MNKLLTRQIPLPIGPDTTPTFDSFVVGANAMAVSQLSGTQAGGAQYYLHGPRGCGKTHLLRAWAGRLLAQGQHVGWFVAGDAQPWQLKAEWSAVIVDGCDDLDEADQRAAFTLFTLASEQGMAFLAAGRAPPADLPLRDDLRSRLAWGQVIGVQALQESETRAAMRREADRRGLLLSDEVLAYVMRRFSRDMKDMMHLLDLMDRYAMAQGRVITVPLLRQMLADDDALVGREDIEGQAT